VKNFLPYIKYLKPVRGRFILALLCGAIYAAASGFGLPFMTSKIFPILFADESHTGVVLAVKPAQNSQNQQDTSLWSKLTDKLAVTKSSPEYFNLGSQNSFSSTQNLYSKQGSQYLSLPAGTRLNIDGTYTSPGSQQQGEAQSMAHLYFKQENSSGTASFIQIAPELYSINPKGELSPLKNTQPSEDPMTLILAVLMLPGVFLIRGLAGYLNTYLIAYCGQTVLESIRLSVFDKLQKVDVDFFQQYGTGDIMARMMTGSGNLQTALTALSNDLIKQPLTFLGAIGALVYLSLQNDQILFILMCFGVIPIVIFPLRKLSKKMLKKVTQSEQGESHMANCLQENIAASRDIRSFNLQNQQFNIFSSATRSYFRRIVGMTRYRAAMSPMVEVITTIGLSVAIYYSAKNGLTLDQVLALIVALYISYDPLKKMASLQPQFVAGSVAITRLETILKAPILTEDKENPVKVDQVEGQIAFDNVNFSYDALDNNKSIDNLSVTINAKETVALVGVSGAGKSTFTHLITRNYDATDGQILLDGTNIKSISKQNLRENISVVSQDPYLFNTTIWENIQLGRLGASREDIQKAAQLAFAHDFIQSLPDGYDTIVGEKATRLSGGQRQRIAIARAFLKNAPILILDEATSALDAESEQAIQKALDELMKGKTTLVIAHRFSSIRNANRILVFEKGQIIADGPHETLIDSSQRYQDLYKKQTL